MPSPRLNRRWFLKATGSLAAAGTFIPYVFTADAEQATRPIENDRFRIGAIGMRYQGSVIAGKAQEYGDIVAICDVDRTIAEKARQEFGGKAELYEDYRKMLARPDLDVITIGAPDHWHAAMAIDACRAGKDVYVEKPLTLTIDEGKILNQVVRETGRVVQVGSWQRSDSRFRLACELVRAGRIGKLQRITVVLGKNVTGGPFPVAAPPSGLNWDLWLGPAPAVPYIAERCHYTFRWWYDYAGGQVTDWGAHNLDIAQWALDADASGPVRIEGKAKLPNVPNGYTVPIDYEARMVYGNGVEVLLKDDGRSGLLFEGDQGRIFVNRGSLEGKPIERLAAQPLPREEFRLYAHDNLARPPRAGKLDAIVNHMGNFFDCVRDRRRPISDVASQHRSATVCHLCNISMRLGRPLLWDPVQERIVHDAEANGWLSRPRRAPYLLQA